MIRHFLLVIALGLLTRQASAQKFEQLALTPPMGWNSWNKFACDGVNEQVIRQMADAMVSSGMKAAGYEYIIIDDWASGSTLSHAAIPVQHSYEIIT